MPDLAGKLQLKQGALYVLNAPRELVTLLARDLGGARVVRAPTTRPSGALLCVTTLAQARKLAPKLFDAVGSEGLAWIAYPKGGGAISTDLNRDRLWAALAESGWRPVRQVALDETWSAMRFRPEAKVKPSAKKKTPRKKAPTRTTKQPASRKKRVARS